VTRTIFGSTVGYPSDSLAFCCIPVTFLGFERFYFCQRFFGKRSVKFPSRSSKSTFEATETD